jgi:hypothetical protein
MNCLSNECRRDSWVMLSSVELCYDAILCDVMLCFKYSKDNIPSMVWWCVPRVSRVECMRVSIGTDGRSGGRTEEEEENAIP